MEGQRDAGMRGCRDTDTIIEGWKEGEMEGHHRACGDTGMEG